jgi:AGCS family alanine or glycine:cation symporter
LWKRKERPIKLLFIFRANYTKSISRMRKIVIKSLALVAAFIVPMFCLAQEPSAEKGIDQKIDEWFAPIASWFESVIFFPIRFSDTVSVPFVVILLVAGALFFTLYFGFINIRRFGLAIRVVRGKYDYLDKNAPHVQPDALNTTDKGDIPDTVKNEAHHGEVNHFQALATAVSGTVGSRYLYSLTLVPIAWLTAYQLTGQYHKPAQ